MNAKEHAQALLEYPDHPVKWAILRALMEDTNRSAIPELESVEEHRFHLLRTIRDGIGADTAGWTDEEAIKALFICVQFDRANCLHLMKIDREDKDCPRGMPWVDQDHFTDYYKMKFRTKESRPTTTRKYLIFAEAHHISEKDKTKLKQLLEPELPYWIERLSDTVRFVE